MQTVDAQSVLFVVTPASADIERAAKLTCRPIRSGDVRNRLIGAALGDGIDRTADRADIAVQKSICSFDQFKTLQEFRRRNQVAGNTGKTVDRALLLPGVIRKTSEPHIVHGGTRAALCR